MTEELDALILEEMKAGWGLTYVLANRIKAKTGVRYPAARILRRLRNLEKVGKVRCEGYLGNMYEWSLA